MKNQEKELVKKRASCLLLGPVFSQYVQIENLLKLFLQVTI